MARSEVVRLVEAHLAENWTACPVFGENTTFEAPKDRSPFVMVQYPYANAERITFGAPGQNWHRETGAFLVTVSVQRGKGTEAGRLWADQIADLFRGRVFGNLRILAPNSAPSDDRNENGNYFQLSFAVPYHFDYLG